MMIWIFIGAVFAIVYFYGVLRAGVRLRRIDILKDDIISRLETLYPIYKRIIKKARHSKRPFTRKIANDRFIRQMKKRDLYHHYQELMALVPEIRKINPYLIRYYHVGRHYAPLKNCQGMLHINKFLTKGKKDLIEDLKHAFVPWNAFSAFVSLPGEFLTLLGVRFYSDTTLRNFGLAVWSSIIGLYYAEKILLQPITELLTRAMPF